MNIEDVDKKVEIPKMPLLGIFELQKKLIEKYDVIEKANGFDVPMPPYSIDSAQLQARIKDMYWRTTEEIAEAMEVVPPIFKLENWKQFWSQDVDVRHFFEELADALHFLVEASIYSNVSESEISHWFAIGLADSEADPLHIQDLVTSVIMKMGLSANVLKNKPWKQTQMPTDSAKFYTLLCHTWKAFGTLWSALKCSIEDIYILYVKKHTVNTWRQDTNY